MHPETRVPDPESRSSDKIVHIAAMAIAAFTLVWISGCGEAVDVDAVQQAKQQAVADAESERQAVLNEGPTPLVTEDFWRVEKKGDVNMVRGATSQTFLRTKGNVEMMQIQHNLNIRGADPTYGWPKSHEEFMKVVVDEWGMPLPRLKEPYEIWYNAETHEIMKRPKQPAAAEETAVGEPEADSP